MDEEYVEDSDNGDNGEAGDRLAEAVGRLDKTQHIKSATKVNAPAGGRTVRVKGLLDVLKRTSDLANVGRNIRNVNKNKSPLVKPLEKRQAEQIKRSTGFLEVKATLDRWNSIVAKNRTTEHREFPLTDMEDGKREPIKPTKYMIKSELELELESLNPDSSECQQEKLFPLTMAEMIEHRKQAARLRAKQSYMEAKARRQSKIKSKKFHKIQRKEKIKMQMKDFEMLQKTNPEEALKKLEQLEKTRAEERVTLRHKSTGHWAKNKLVRAKYDKDTRQELAQQLAISRELTQKINVDNGVDSDEEINDENEKDVILDSSNPWLQTNNDTVEYSEYVGGYKKYWEERNKSLSDNDHNITNIVESKTDVESLKTDEVEELEVVKDVNKYNKVNPKEVKKNKNNEKSKMKKIKRVVSTSDWNVEISSDAKSVDGMFDELDAKLNKKISTKLNTLKTSFPHKESNSSKMKKPKKNNESELSKLSFKSMKNRPRIDEELNEETTTINSVSNVKDNFPSKSLTVQTSVKNNAIAEIDPNKFVAPKIRHLQTTLPDAELGEDHLDDENNIDEKQMTIAEAFEDDDIVANFRQEKQDEIDKDKPQIDDAFLPGWGLWTGKNISLPRRKRKRLYANTNIKLPRKDDKKDNLIINHNTGEKLKAHLVSELPFPFTSVKDFESTMRAPIGNTFIPETAHKKLTQPAVTVKTGVIIRPMDESQLVSKQKSKDGLPDKQKRKERSVPNKNIKKRKFGSNKNKK